MFLAWFVIRRSSQELYLYRCKIEPPDVLQLLGGQILKRKYAYDSLAEEVLLSLVFLVDEKPSKSEVIRQFSLVEFSVY